MTTIQENIVTRKILPGGRNDWTKVSEEKEEGRSLVVIHLTLRMVMAFQTSHMILSILCSYLIGTTGKKILPFLLIGQPMVNTVSNACCGLCSASISTMEITDVEIELGNHTFL